MEDESLKISARKESFEILGTTSLVMQGPVKS